MPRSPAIRHAFGAALGTLSGIGLCLGILPLVLQFAGHGSRLALGYYLSRYAFLAALLMGAGGWLLARTRNRGAAMAVFSLAGLITGLLLVGAGLEYAPRLLAAGAATGWLAGLVGGSVFGRIVGQPVDAGGEVADAEPDLRDFM